MKLYATITSERASKGQGGNDFLIIEVTSPDYGAIDNFLTINLNKVGREQNGKQEYRLIIKNRHLTLVDRSHWVNLKTKGEKQKGDKSEQANESGKCKMHNVRNCWHCHD